MIPQVKSDSRYSYRPGEWGTIVGVYLKEGYPDSPRPCYVVMFSDGVTDSWVVNDPDAQYEYRNVNPASLGQHLLEQQS